MKPFRAAAVQLCSTPDIDLNLAAAAAWIAKAAGEEADFIVLPENFSYLGPEKEKIASAEEIARRSEQFLLEQAETHGCYILGGGYAVPAPVEGKTFSRALLVRPGGTVAFYDKIHLFDVNLPGQALRESDGVTHGADIVIAPLEDLGRIGLSICYDLRFPELYRKLSAQGAEILVAPSAFTKYTGAFHWHMIVRTRAVENTCFMIAPNQCGNHFDDRFSYGHSLIVDPWGEILAEAGKEPGVILADLDPERLDVIRTRLPSLQHRRM